jgi:hypothetical protein
MPHATTGLVHHAGEALEHTPAYSGKRRRSEIFGQGMVKPMRPFGHLTIVLLLALARGHCTKRPGRNSLEKVNATRR